MAERLQDGELLAYGHFDVGATLLWVAARTHLERAIALYDPQWGGPATSRAGSRASKPARLAPRGHHGPKRA
jgi:hypothetical protein